MSQKPPPPMFSRTESIKVFATPKALRWGGSLLVLLLAPISAQRLLHPEPQKIGPIPLPVPAQEWTTEAQGTGVIPTFLGALPRPGPNQKRAGHCDPERSQVEIAGGCWVKTEHPRPCPEGKQWEHEGKCWLPVAEAKPVPQSGEPQMVNVAGEP